jgi:hypothetical protein
MGLGEGGRKRATTLYLVGLPSHKNVGEVREPNGREVTWTFYIKLIKM